jgi:hypothetical protein
MQLQKKRKNLPGFMCCRQSALSICMVSLVNAQCRETRSLAANRSLRVSILLAAEGNTIKGRFVFPLAFTDTTKASGYS